ncbi:MAG: hypothetical protein ACQEWU_02280 [Bacillota bacterium]|uniref:hypothetical protein n=1 Tax=Virgibacillus TaxID=84406 RepID=UPI0013CE781E|nr:MULTISPECIES: hypothetical protein [Virgibacillus]QRZ16735.1 hypothetical protein JUJ52_13095 [Virgibacillus sp. AGTR]WBX79775.1 hypothetical protein PD280_19335 [Virgibacillus salarius]
MSSFSFRRDCSVKIIAGLSIAIIFVTILTGSQGNEIDNYPNDMIFNDHHFNKTGPFNIIEDGDKSFLIFNENISNNDIKKRLIEKLTIDTSNHMNKVDPS